MNTFQETSADALGSTIAGNNPDSSAVGLSPSDSLSTPVAAQDPKDPAFYLQQLPLTEEDLKASDLIIADGLYNMAKIYKDKLEDLPLSIETFETLERRFPENEYRLESYYQLYLMSLRLEDPLLTAKYKDKLTRSFPESDYTVAVSDPNYVYNMQMMDRVQDSIYEATYNHYLAGDTSLVRKNYREVTSAYPLSKLLPKFTFLEALTYVQSGDANRFKDALKALVEKYPKADVTELAGEMLKGVLRGRSMVQGGITGMKWNLRFGLGENGELAISDSARVFTAGVSEPYRMLLIYPTGKADRNQLLFTVAAFNFANFMVKEFDLSGESFGEMSMLFIRGFVGLDEILQYYKMIHQESGYASAIEKTVGILPISETNYETLIHGKTLDEYISFFNQNYGETAPEIVARWRARLSEEAEEPVKTSETPAVSDLEVQETESEKAAIISPAITIQQEVVTQADSIPAVQIPETKELTLKEIQAIRAREAAEAEALKKQKRDEFEAQQKIEKELQEQKAKERADILKKQEEENQALLTAKANREKNLEKEQKERLKQTEAARKQKIKEREALRKQKEREYKQQLKKREAERKKKEKLYQQKLRDREKIRREAQKQK